jgi:hypothetical protein
MEDLLARLVIPFINFGSLFIVVIGIYKYWILAEGASRLRQVFALQIVIGTINFVINGLVVYKHPDVWGTLAFQLVIVWSVLMSIKGLKNDSANNRKYVEQHRSVHS